MSKKKKKKKMGLTWAHSMGKDDPGRKSVLSDA
jgi:hypothetical protein